MKKIIAILAATGLSACQSSGPPTLIFPDKTLQPPAWTESERARPIAIRPLHSDADSSAFLIRLNASEMPHYHDHHDLSVTILSGSSRVHFKEHTVSAGPGDVVFIPKGSYHWAENTGPSATVLFAVFSPQYAGKDKRLANQQSTRQE